MNKPTCIYSKIVRRIGYSQTLASLSIQDYSYYMNRILVCSDIHGDIQALHNLLSKIEEEKADHLLFAGDLGIDRLGLEALKLRQLSIASTFVRGNCDSVWSFSEAGYPLPTQYATLPFEGRTIFLTHGHLILSWQTAPLPLETSDIFINGHTHRSLLLHPKDHPIQLNPGSAASPRDRRPPTYAMITTKEITIKLLTSGKIVERLRLKL